jgi:monoamine oxidase
VRETLGSTVVSGRVVLAGEHVNSTHPATVQGAYRSGQNAARLLTERGVARATKTIVVIGAGVAGLAAAQALKAAGATVVVLESRDRIGGRVWTDTSWGAPIELGAAWVHGVKRNPVPALVRSGGSTLVPTNYDDQVVHTTAGVRLKGLAPAEVQLDRIVTKMGSRPSPIAASVGAVLRASGWQSSVLNNWLVETHLTQEYGLGPAMLGAQALYEGDWLHGGDALVKGGYNAVPNELARGIAVRLSSPAIAVSARSGQAAVTLRSGEILGADGVVVAVPLSILQRRALRIEGLPTPARLAIDGLRMGSLEKVILQYSDRWWPQAQVFGVVGGPDHRWAAWFDLTELVGAPTLVGFSAATAAAGRPQSDAACMAEAANRFAAAFG